MKWPPWKPAVEERVERFQASAEEAANELSRVEAQWQEVRTVVDRATRHRELNGWNRIARTLIEGDRR